MPNVLHYQPCDAAQVTNAHISYHVRNVSFTGSTNIGYITVFTAGKYIKPVLLELGGEASAVDLDDANLEKRTMSCTLGSFLHGSIVLHQP